MSEAPLVAPPPSPAPGVTAVTPGRGSEGILEAIMPLLGTDELQGKVEEIKAERKLIQATKAKLTNKIRNEQRKRSRLVKRSSGLKTAELLTVLRLREEAIRKKQK